MKIKLHSPTTIVVASVVLICCGVLPSYSLAAATGDHFDKEENNQLVQSDSIGVANRANDQYQLKKLPSAIALRTPKKISAPAVVAIVDRANENSSKSAIPPADGDDADANKPPYKNIPSVSTPRFDLEVSRTLDDSTFESACNKTFEEINLEEQVDTLEAQLVQERKLVDDAELLYNQSLNAFYVAYNESNAVFDTLLGDEEVLEKSGNDTVDDLNEFLVAEETLRVPEGEVNSTISDFNSSFAVFVAKNETYNQALENGDPDEIEAAEAALNAATLSLNNTVQSLVAALIGWNTTLHLVDEKAQQASASIHLYFNAFDAWNATAATYGTKLTEVNATRTSYLNKDADLETAENTANQTRQLLYDAQDALEQARDDAFQACLESNFTSNTDRLRDLGDGGRKLTIEDCTALQTEVSYIEERVKEAQEALEKAEKELKDLRDSIQDIEGEVGDLDIEYRDSEKAYEKAKQKEDKIQKEINEIFDKFKKDNQGLIDAIKTIIEETKILEKIIGDKVDISSIWNSAPDKEDIDNMKKKAEEYKDAAIDAALKKMKRDEDKKKRDDKREEARKLREDRDEKKDEITRKPNGYEDLLEKEKQELEMKKKELRECQEKCPPTGNGNGDPHFTTFSGVSFDYHGECDLVMVSSPGFASGSGLAVHVRTTRMNGPLLSYSYISGAAVGIGKDVMEVQLDGSLVLNGRRYVGKDAMGYNDKDNDGNNNNKDKNDAVTIPDTFATYPLVKNMIGKKKRIVQYVLSLADNDDIKNRMIMITIHANTKTHMLFVKIDGDVRDGVGLLGEPRAGDRLMGRDGVADMSYDWNAYGEEWQVRDFEPKLFQEHRAPQYPSGCYYEEESHQKQQPKTNLRRRLLGRAGGEVHTITTTTATIITIEDATDACADYTGVKKEHCVYDVMAMGDLEVADDPAYA